MPATLAEAPMGVAMPPMSVPLDMVQARVCRSIPMVSDRDRITGTITVAMGILSTKAEAAAVNQMRITTIQKWLPPLSPARKLARPSSTWVCSRPLTVTDRPMIKPTVFQSTCRSNCRGDRVQVRVMAAAATPMVGMVRPVAAWVIISRITPAKIPTLTRNFPLLGMASAGFKSKRAGSLSPIPARSLVRKHRAKYTSTTPRPTRQITPLFRIKSQKPRPREVPRMMLGGSPLMVAAPPRLAVKISAMIRGTGSK